MTGFEQELFHHLIQTQEDLISQAKNRNDLLSKHTADYVAVEEKRTIAIERFSDIIKSALMPKESETKLEIAAQKVVDLTWDKPGKLKLEIFKWDGLKNAIFEMWEILKKGDKT